MFSRSYKCLLKLNHRDNINQNKDYSKLMRLVNTYSIIVRIHTFLHLIITARTSICEFLSLLRSEFITMDELIVINKYGNINISERKSMNFIK